MSICLNNINLTSNTGLIKKHSLS